MIAMAVQVYLRRSFAMNREGKSELQRHEQRVGVEHARFILRWEYGGIVLFCLNSGQVMGEDAMDVSPVAGSEMELKNLHHCHTLSLDNVRRCWLLAVVAETDVHYFLYGSN